MIGTFRTCDGDIRTELEDYRDPPPRILPEAKQKVVEKKSKEKQADSMREIRSNDIVWDTLHDLNLLKTSTYRNYAEFRNKQRAILFNLPALDVNHIRRGKTPAALYVPMELYSEKYAYASQLLIWLFKLHQEIINDTPKDGKKQVPLHNKPKYVRILGNILKNANIFMYEGEYEKLISLLYYTARYFENKGKSWWWLTNEFYKLAKPFSLNFRLDIGYSEALVNYMYGRFLLIKDNNPEQALECFSKCLRLSKGKLWDVEWDTGVTSERLAVYSAYLYHMALLMEAERVVNTNPKLAMEYSKKAVHVLKEGNWHPDLEEAIMDLAIYSTLSNCHEQAIEVLEALEKSLETSKDKKMYLCVQLLLAVCYQKGSRPDKALSQLLYTSELGKKWDQPWLVALVQKYLGEYFMNQGRMVTARKFFTSSIILNKKEGNFKDLVRSLYLYGYSKGLEHAKEYVELLITAKPDTESYDKLLKFLSHGEPFWEEKQEKRYVVVPKKMTLLSKKSRLSATDKVYMLLKKKLGKEFAECAVEEIEKFGKRYKSKEPIDLLDDPTERKYHRTIEEAKACKFYLKNKYKKLNNHLKKKYNKFIKFNIEERMVESETTEEKFRENMNCVVPIIPYNKDSLMYKEAVKTIDSYLNPKPRRDEKVYIEYPGPKVAVRLLNSIDNYDNVAFYSDEPIKIEEIAEEMVMAREMNTIRMEQFKKVLRLRKLNTFDKK